MFDRFCSLKKNGIHSMQDWTATMSDKKKKHKKIIAYRESV